MRTKHVGREDLGRDDLVLELRGVVCVYLYFGVPGYGCQQKGVSHLSAKRRSLAVLLFCVSAETQTQGAVVAMVPL